jgi:hypothetical protein
MDERIFFEYGDVKVTNARFINGGQTYAMNNVTSVKPYEKKPSRIGGIVVLLIGIAVAVETSFATGLCHSSRSLLPVSAKDHLPHSSIHLRRGNHCPSNVSTRLLEPGHCGAEQRYCASRIILLARVIEGASAAAAIASG